MINPIHTTFEPVSVTRDGEQVRRAIQVRTFAGTFDVNVIEWFDGRWNDLANAGPFTDPVAARETGAIMAVTS